MAKKSVLFDLLSGIRDAKELVGEVKDLYPNIAGLLGGLTAGPSGNIDASAIKNAISFAVHKIQEEPHYVLGVSPKDPMELIEAVHKVKAKFYHPDNKETGNADRFIKIQDAYTQIRNMRGV